MNPSCANPSIVIVADTLFYPPRRNGFSVRYFPLIQELKRIGYQIDIIVINKYKESYTSNDLKMLNSICNRVDIIQACATPLKTANRLIRKIYNSLHMLVPIGIPHHLIDNYRSIVYDSMTVLLNSRETYDFGIGVSMGGYNADLLLSLGKEIRPRKIICDFVDSDYLMRKRSSHKFIPLLKTIMHIENEKTRLWERSMCNRCECIYISEEDAKTVSGKNVSIIPNSIVVDGFDSSSIINLESPNIAFLGNMGYPPNIAACKYLIKRLLPAIKARIPNIHLYVIGRNPGKEILIHRDKPHIHITGEVENIWNYIRSANVFIFPMLAGAGLQNKILEAMYAAKPVITSPIGNEGIEAVHGRDILIAKNVEEYVESVDKAFSHGTHIGDSAREFVQEHFSSRRLVINFDKLLCNKLSQ